MGLIDAGFLAVKPGTPTEMYDAVTGFNETCFARYAGPVIELIIGPDASDAEYNAAYTAAVKLTRDRRGNHRTFWRTRNYPRPLRFGGTLGIVPPPPKWSNASDSEVNKGHFLHKGLIFYIRVLFSR